MIYLSVIGSVVPFIDCLKQTEFEVFAHFR